MILGIISKESIYSQSKVGIISKYLLGIMPANENTGREYSVYIKESEAEQLSSG